ncbi:MAG: type II secretion system F family protein [Planctomycetes bacterium]|nr:type II secretion system F family protein [Planctomycetota bacterium]
MKEFKYTARSTTGKQSKGTVNAVNRIEATNELRKKGLTLLTIEEAGKKSGGLFSSTPAKKASTEELVIFTRQLSTMISAGIPLLECLEVLQEQIDKPGLKLVLGEVIEKVRSGSDFSESITAYPRVFSKIYINMIKAGEASGQLDIILIRLAEYLESAQALKREIKSAMTYPVISLTLILLIVVGLMVFIIPQFEKIFKGLGVDLPLPTRVLMLISLIMKSYYWAWVPGIIGIIVGLMAIIKTNKGAYYYDWLSLRLPVFGDLFKKVAVSRFARTFSTLIKSGVPILGALEIVASTSGNRLLEDAINTAKENVRKGETLSEPLSRSKIFPPMVTRMIGIGEKSGALESLLEKISEFYDQQVKTAVEGLTSMIEPLMIGMMGVIVGGIVIAIMMPIFEIQKSIGKKK